MQVNDWYTHLFLKAEDGTKLLRNVCRKFQGGAKRFLVQCPCGKHDPFFIYA